MSESLPTRNDTERIGYPPPAHHISVWARQQEAIEEIAEQRSILNKREKTPRERLGGSTGKSGTERAIPAGVVEEAPELGTASDQRAARRLTSPHRPANSATSRATGFRDHWAGRLCWNCHGRVLSCGTCHGHSVQCVCPSVDRPHVAGCLYRKANPS